MDYKKAYEEALERAKRWADGTLQPERTTPQGVCEAIFPELAESEDERIRKELVNFILYKVGHLLDEETEHRFIAYLEKQKKIPMPDSTQLIEWWDEEEAMLKEKDFRDDTWRIAQNAFMDGVHYGWRIKQKKQKPVDTTEIAHCINCPVYEKAEWSEEDERIIGRLRSVVNQLACYTDSLDVNGDYCDGDYAKLDDWLNDRLMSLRPQPKQEWSEEDEK